MSIYVAHSKYLFLLKNRSLQESVSDLYASDLRRDRLLVAEHKPHLPPPHSIGASSAHFGRFMPLVGPIGAKAANMLNTLEIAYKPASTLANLKFHRFQLCAKTVTPPQLRGLWHKFARALAQSSTAFGTKADKSASDHIMRCVVLSSIG
ncbi:hypothetical protein [Comamonas guangdongensis]|uniref:hypothetical protein n=1 Tax=Comamonas guangdongensis TaxID=510515 RepID=UPI0034E22D32